MAAWSGDSDGGFVLLQYRQEGRALGARSTRMSYQEVPALQVLCARNICAFEMQKNEHNTVPTNGTGASHRCFWRKIILYPSRIMLMLAQNIGFGWMHGERLVDKRQ